MDLYRALRDIEKLLLAREELAGRIMRDMWWHRASEVRYAQSEILSLDRFYDHQIRESIRERAEDTVANVFKSGTGWDQKLLADIGSIMARDTYFFKKALTNIRAILPGGTSLVLTNTAQYDRIGIPVGREMSYRVNVLPALNRITVPRGRWEAWRQQNGHPVGGSQGGEVNALHGALGLCQAAAYEDEDTENVRLYFECPEQAVLIKMSL